MYSSGRSVNDWLPLFFMLLFHSLHLHQLFYNCPCITRKFKNRFLSARNTRVLEIFCNTLCFNPLPLLIEIHALFDVNVCCNLRQVILQSASNDRVICVKMRGNSIHFTRQSEWSCIAQGRKQSLTPSPLLRRNEGNKASPPTPLQGEGSNMFANYIVLKTPFPKHFTPLSLERGWG